jgi:hypothetical protein
MKALYDVEQAVFDMVASEINQERQKEVFRRMIQNLEKVGECRGVYHNLAFVLFVRMK